MSSIRRTSDPLNTTHHWWHGFKLSTQKFAIVLTLGAFIMGFSYVWMTNTTAATGFDIDNLQAKVSALQEQNERLELQAADLRALSGIELSSQSLDLQPADSFSVLGTVGGPVAVQR